MMGTAEPLRFQGLVAGGCYQGVLQMSDQQWLALPQQYRQTLVEGLTMPRLRQQRVERHWYPNVEFLDTALPMYSEEKRALNLLHRFLTPEQWACLGAKGYFEVTVKEQRFGRTARLHRFQIHQHYGVYEVKVGGRRHYCLVALEPGLPEWDWMLMVKLLLESDLKKFFATAKSRGWQPLSCNQFA